MRILRALERWLAGHPGRLDTRERAALGCIVVLLWEDGERVGRGVSTGCYLSAVEYALRDVGVRVW